MPGATPRHVSASRSGTPGGGRPCWHAIASGSSRSTTPPLPHGLLFGSEVKAILEHPAAPRELDEDALADYLTFGFAPSPRTMFRGIGKLGPGEAMTVAADGATRRWSWWDAMPSASVSSAVAQMGEAEMVGEVRRLLRESIRKRMMSDVPFGVFLSGGLDSSTNVALMAELTDAPVRTYSTAPRGHARYDELRYARLVASHFATDHHEVLVDEEAMRAFIPQLVFHQDEPLSDWTAIPQHFVTRLARDSGTIVVQVGEGADELFHGYKGYVDHRRVVVPFQRLLPRAVRRPVGALAVHATARVGRAVRHGEALYDAGHSWIPYWGGALCFRGPLKERLLRGDHPDALRIAERIWDEAGANRSDADIFQRMTYLELRQRLPELLLSRMDRIAMASSVEAREPFLDHELVEFVMALPPAMKHRDGHGKHVLREAMCDVLPHEVLARSKQRFASPMEEWLSGAFGRDAQAAVGRSALPTAEWRGRRRRLCSGLPPAAPQISSRRDFWTEYQPGFRASDAPVGSQAFFADVEAHRYALEPHIGELVEFGRWSGKSVLDAGCGVATDGMRFVRAGTRYTGIDFSPTALELARRRLELEGGEARFVHGSIANLPFPDASFDLVYSHGVIHHLPDTGA